MGKRADRKVKSVKRREELKRKIIAVISEQLPDTNAPDVTPEQLRECLSQGMRAADQWINKQAKKNPQEKSMIISAAYEARQFIQDCLDGKLQESK